MKSGNGKPLFSRKKWIAFIPVLFILPAFILHACVVTLPSLSTLVMSLYDWNGIGNATFIGLDNFKEIFTKDEVIGIAIINNLKWLAVFLTIPIILGMFVAVLVSHIKKGQMFLRTAYFLPYVLSAAIAGKIWSSFFNPYFGFSVLFRELGLDNLAKTLWLGDTKIALFSVAFVDNWHWWGFIMVLFLGALQQIDTAQYESARVEGANKWQEYIYITIPGIMPTLTFVMITTVMWSFLTFDYVWIMTSGGPGHATEILSTWIYKNAFVQYRSGYANAICVLQSGLCVVLYFVQRFIQKRGWDV